MLKTARASAVVLCALAGTCFAQADDLCTLPAQQLKTPPAGMHFLPRTEVNQLVYAITSPSDNPAAGNSRGTGGSAKVVNDGQFPNFPPAQNVTFPLGVNGIAYGWIAFGPANATNPTFDFQVVFYDDIIIPGPAASCGAPAFYSNVLGTFRANGIAPAWGFVQWFQDPLGLVDANGNPTTINFPDGSWAHETTILHAGTNNVYRGTDPFTSVSQVVPLARGGGGAVPAVGTSNPQYWKNDPAAAAGVDANANGTEDYSEVCPNGTNAIAGSAASRRDIYLKLQADIPAPPPPNFVDQGTIDCANGATTFNTDVLPGAVSWHRFVMSSDASVDASSYMDIVAGDSTGFTDCSMGLYTADGILVASDQDNGDLNQAFITLGHGRRGAVGDSILGDGRNGDAFAGTYYIAVAGGNAGFGESSFSVNAVDTIDAGPVSVTISHNTGAVPCALPDPVAPFGTDLGTLPAGPTTAQVLVGFGEVGWYLFTTSYDVADTNANFLDITTTGTELGDSEIGLYSSTGALLGNDDDSADGLLSQLSFSGPGAPARPAAGDGLLREGQNGSNVPAGTYYLCVGLFDTDFRTTGWQARSNSGSRLNINVNIFTPSGCVLDLNGDGNVDPDDLSDAIACFFGPDCTLDLNGDGGEDPDDLADYIAGFFSGCP